MNQLTAIDLFSGCGGSAWGFKEAGFKIKAAVDIDDWSLKTYIRNYPDIIVLKGDIREISGEELLEKSNLKKRELTVLLACPPCQGFSSARSKSLPYDPRNELLYDFVRLVEELEPKMIAMENVPGLSHGVGMEIFSDAVAKLHKIGYTTVSDVLNASEFGVPQNRKRVILLGTRLENVKLKLPETTHGSGENLIPKVTVRDTITDLPPILKGEKHISDPMHVSANLSEINLKRLKITRHDGGGWKDWPDELKLECQKKGNGGHGDVYGRMRWNEPSPTLTSGCTSISKGRFGHPEQNRAISLREAARLQSFPDTYIFEGTFTNISEQIGNAVPPLLAKKIAEALIDSY